MSEVRTRFAPSPTGWLHVGGLRTALFNYLFARRSGGAFILRIEDTDRERYVEGAAEKLMESLAWVGLDFDEGPGVGGSYGPYVQSERSEVYRKHAEHLIDSGNAYYCFCTPEELEAMRERQQARGLPTGYDGTWRDRPEAEIRTAMESGKPYVARLRMPQEGETRFTDLVRGEVAIQNEQVDDQVLLKSDGLPTYHLANVVDDHMMRISHVIRGEEWLLSVPKHLQLYKAFGWEPPRMAHLPLLLNEDRSKLSKRQGDVAVEDYRDHGYLPEALLNFIALLGWNPGTDEEFFSLERLMELFSLERVNKSGSVFDTQKLNWMNGHYIRNFSPDEAVTFLQPFLRRGGLDTSDGPRTAKIIQAVYTRLSRGDEILALTRIFYNDELQVEDPEALQHLASETTRSVLEAFLEEVRPVKFLDVAGFKQMMKRVQERTGVKGPGLWKPMRVALTGELSGPELPAVIEIFGKEKVCSFIQQALDRYVL